MTNHTDILSQAIHALRERGLQYGSVESTFDRTARIATILLNTEITPYEVTMVLVATKLARLQESRTLDDNYIDAMNYLAMAAQFAPIHEPPKVTPKAPEVPPVLADAVVEADIAKIAKQFAPQKPLQVVEGEAEKKKA